MKNTKAFKIVSSVPLPATARSQYAKWPFGEMKVGDSFFVPDEIAGPAANILRPAAAYYAKRHPNWHYTTRREDGGYRVWRTEAPPTDFPRAVAAGS